MSGRTIELQFRFTGSDADLRKIVDGMKGVGNEAQVSGKKLKIIEDGVKGVSDYSKQAEKTITGLRSQLAGMQADGGKAANEIRKLREEIAKVGESGNAFEGFHERISENLEHPFSSARIALVGWLDKMSAGTAIMAGVGIGAGVLGTKMFELVEATAREAQATSNMAARLGISADQMDKLQAMAKIAGVEVGAIEGASRLLAAALQEDAGASNKTVIALNKLGVSTITVTGQQREMGEVVVEVLEKLSKVENTSQRVALAQQTLGRASREFLPLIMNYERLRQVVEGLGVEFDETDQKLAKAAEDIASLDVAWEEFKKHLAGKIDPIVIPVVTYVTEVIAGKKSTNVPSLEGTAAQMIGQAALEKLGLGGLNPSAQLNWAPPPLPSGMALQEAYLKEDVARGDALVKQFQNRSKSVEDQKKQLEELQKKAEEVKGNINKGGQTEATIRGEETQFYALQRQITDLKASIKAAEELPGALQRLSDAEQSIADDAMSGLRKTVENFKREDEKLLQILGAPFSGRIAQLYASQRLDAIKKEAAAESKRLIEELKQNSPGFRPEAAENGQLPLLHADLPNAKDFERSLSKQDADFQKDIEADKKAIDHLDQMAKAEAEILKSRGSRNSAQAEKRVGLTSQDDELGQARQVAGIRIAAANAEYAAEKKRIDEVLASDHTIEEGNQAELDLVKARGALEESIDKARMEAEDAILELRKKNLEEYRGAAETLFKDLFTRSSNNRFEAGSNLQKTFSNLGRQQLSTIFSNAVTPLVQAGATSLGVAGGVLSGNNPVLGGLLKGTIFDKKNATANTALEHNTSSLDQLRAAVDTLTSSLTGRTVGSGSVVPESSSGIVGQIASGGGLAGAAAGATVIGTGSEGVSLDDLNNLPVGTAASADAVMNTILRGGASGGVTLNSLLSGAASIFPHTDANGNTTGGLFSGLYNGGNMSTGQVIGNSVGSAAAAFGAAEGALHGFQEGGAKGDSAAVGSILGLASMIPGPQQPFVAAGALISGFVSSLLPDPRTQRQNQINEELQKATYVAPNAINATIDSQGNIVQTDQNGQNRILNATPTIATYNQAIGYDAVHTNRLITAAQQQLGYNWGGSTPMAPVLGAPPPAQSSPMIVQVQTMDSQSFVQNSGKIADAMVVALQSGHRVASDIKGMVKPI